MSTFPSATLSPTEKKRKKISELLHVPQELLSDNGYKDTEGLKGFNFQTRLISIRPKFGQQFRTLC